MAKRNKEILGAVQGTDDWLLATDCMDSVFRAIYTVLEHNTGYRGFEQIPLEIAIGVQEYDKWADLSGPKMVMENGTIAFLKDNLVRRYSELYKQNNGKSIIETFIVITDSAYQKLDVFDKINVKQIREDETKELSNMHLADVEYFRKRGQFFAFLDKIGKSTDSLFRRVDCLYVKPKEYESIKEALERNNIVFLIGDPEIGKTYCATRIMWEYYQQGILPVWHYGGEGFERARLRRKISDCDLRCNNSINYFEDIFGRTKYENREDLRRSIGAFIEKAKMVNSRVIVSSREKVFREFEQENVSENDLKQFIVEMALKKPSYTEEAMKMILFLWALEFSCTWLSNNALANQILKEATENLKTPLGLREFASSSVMVNNYSELENLIQLKAKKTQFAFGEEIAEMNKESRLFLTLVCILKSTSTIVVKEIYNRYCDELGLDLEANPIERIEAKYSSRVTKSKWSEKEEYEFTHPTYEEGVVASWNRYEIKGFFSKVIESLSTETDPHVRGSCGYLLIQYYDEIPDKEQATKIILKVLKDKKTNARMGVAQSVESNFKRIQSPINMQLLSIMMKDKNRYIRVAAVTTARYNYSRLKFSDAVAVIELGIDDRAAEVRLDAIQGVRSLLKLLPNPLIDKAFERSKDLCKYKGWDIGESAIRVHRFFKEELTELRKLDSST